MKILFTGGGSGGNFYPLVAVAEAIREKVSEEKLLEPELYYMAPEPYNPTVLLDNRIVFKKTSAGKARRYFSLLNITDIFKTAWGILGAIIEVYNIYPDVVFAKGGYASFPALVAARIFRIPVVIHESDSVPGRLNMWAGRFARKIAVSYPEAAQYFKKEKVAYTGNPIRKEIIRPMSNGAHEFLKLEPGVPVVFVMGGSQGAQIINDTLIDALSLILNDFQVIHQTGKNNFAGVKSMADVVLANHPFKHRYHPVDYLNDLAVRMSAGVADVIVSRAGSTIFEIAAWGVPSILIPITDSNGDHQRKNAYHYARTGAAVVMEESNLSGPILSSEIHRLIANPDIRENMKKAAQDFAKLDAAAKIAGVILEIALEHEQ
jgi:UDP-N-acetylglucosamine--N-acetylmuramyl-(pentapeptide) pyrophosphoryl-undecaprenol N-acetylglucosamine transferase